MSTVRPAARFVKPGEALAMAPSAIHSGPQGFFWLFGNGTSPSERRGDVAIVHVRDPLEHHSTAWADNYEDILRRVREAMTGEDECQRHERQHRWDDDYQPMQATPPAAVILCLDSPGGVVSGLNETVRALRKARLESGVPLVAYVNEMAASAAYALACACDEIVCPPSAILGSIGVISTMVSQAEHDRKEGFEFRLITSGARKADGHVHAPITDAAEEAEASRVAKLAAAFFKIASRARGMPIETIQGLEASIYLGTDARKRGLADAVMSFDDAIDALSKAGPPGDSAAAGGNETDRRAAKGLDGVKKTRSLVSKVTLTSVSGGTMSIQLAALIKTTRASIAAEKDPAKRKALRAELATLESAQKSIEAGYKKVEKHVEHIKSEEDDDEEDDDAEEDDEEEAEEEEEEAEEKKSAKAAEEEEKKSSKGGAEEEEKKAQAAVFALAAAATGKRGKAVYGALSALLDKASQFDSLSSRVSKIEKESRRSKRDTLIQDAINAGRITKAMAARAKLGSRKLEMVESYLEMFPTALIHTSEDDLEVPNTDAQSPHAAGAPLPKHVTAQIDEALRAAPQGIDKEALRARLEESHRRSLNGAANGVRY